MPGSIRALRRQADPVRGGGRIPITKRRTVGRPQFREPGTDTLSRQEEAIADAIEDAYATIPRETLLNAVETADTAGYARTVLGYLTAASSGIEEVLLESFVSSGETSAIDLGRELSRQYRQVGKAETPSPSEVALQFRFNATDPRATTWARNEAGRLITNMAQSEQAMFRRLVEQSFTEGRTPQSAASSIFRQLQTVTPTPTARDFAESIGGNLNGLTERYERAVMNRVADLGDDLAKRGVSGTRALEQMRKEGDKYATKLRRARSRTIARTERMMAHNEARLLSYQQAIDDGLMSREHSRKVWSTGPFDVCPICVAMSGVEAKIADPFTLPNGSQVQAPPGHPNCRCTLQTRTDVDLYDPPQALGTGVPGDPYRVGGREVSDQGRKFDTPVTDTQRIHTTTRNGRSAYKPERIRQVHDPWVRESLEDGVAHGDTRVTFMGGGSGAGKGSIQKSGDVTFRRGTTIVDSDKAKKAIPEYREMVDAGDNKAAAFAHEESSDMAQRLMAESIDSGFDTVLDGTGDSTFEKMAGKVARARQQGGQRVVAEYVTIDTDEALRRAAQRAANTGREVPEDVIHGTHEAVSKIFPKLADADTFDELRLWDNMGDRPELIYEKIDGVERVLNRERYDAFLRKDPDYRPRIFSPDVDQIVTPGVPMSAPTGLDVPRPSGTLSLDLDDLRPRARVITAADDFDDLIESEPMILTGKDGKQIDMGIRQPIRRAPQKWYDRYTSGQYGEYQKLGHYDVTALPEAADSLDAILEAGRRAGQVLDDELQRRLPNLVSDATGRKALLDEAEKALAERWSLQYEAVHSGYRATLREAAETAPTRYANILRKQADSDDLMVGYQTRPEPAKEKSVLNALRKVEDDNPIIERLLRNRYGVADGIDLDDALRAQGMTRREAFDKVFGENGSDDLAQALERLVENHPVTIELRSEYDDVWRAVQEARIARDVAQEAIDGARADIVEEIMRSTRDGFGTGSIRSRISRADTRGGAVVADDVMTVVDTVSRRVPVEWVDQLEPHEIKWVERGHYEFDSKRINISGHANDQGLRHFTQRTWQSTLHHELTHAFQFSNPTIPRAERLFMARRAQERAAQIGDDFWELRPIYKDRLDEQRLVLDLQPGDAYIDKAYGGFNTPGSGANPTELSTKATELLFNGGDISPEVRDFILGLLLLG